MSRDDADGQTMGFRNSDDLQHSLHNPPPELLRKIREQVTKARVAFQFSGGKDSTAALYFIKKQWAGAHWEDIRFYTLDSGDMFPETKAFVEQVAQDLPNHTWVRGRQAQAIEQFGPPSDLIPFGSSEEAHLLKVGYTPMMQNRVTCCLRSKMLPMHERMVADGITHIVRGQRKEEKFKGPLVDSERDPHFRVLYPIENWTEEQVWEYLRKIDRVPPLYASGIQRSGDCMTCSAWLGDGRPDYLRQHHPEPYLTFKGRIIMIDNAIDRDIGEIERARHAR